jgi:hypothetical protein
MQITDEKRQRLREYDRRYRERHHEKLLIRWREQNAKHSEKRSAKKRSKRQEASEIDKAIAYEARPDVIARRKARYHFHNTKPGAKERMRKWRREHPDIVHAATQNWRYSPRGTTKTLLASAALRAQKAQLPFNITFDEIYPLVLAGACQRTGIEFSNRSASISKCPRPFAPSIDRIDPRLGYVKGNVQVVLWMYNRCKGVGTDDDVLAMARALVAKNKIRLAS